MTIEVLENELKNNKLNAIYLLYGEETYLIETVQKKIKKLFGDILQGINYIQIDETNIDTLIDNINMPAFGYDKKLIIVKNSGLFGKKANFQEIFDYIKENIDTIKETVLLVFIEEEVNKNELYTIIEKEGTICNFEKLKPFDIIKRLKAIVSAYSVNIDDSTLKYLIDTSGTSMQVLINEIRKLIEFAGKGGTITTKDVDLLSIKSLDSIIFDLTDSLGKKDTKKALDTLNNLLYNKEPIQRILITLYNHFKKLYLVKLAEESGKNIPQSLNLKPNQMFLVSKYRNQASYFTKDTLGKILEEFIDLDSNYKIGLIDVNIGLEAILCTYM